MSSPQRSTLTHDAAFDPEHNAWWPANVISELVRPAPAEVVVRWLDSIEAGAVATTAIAAAELRYGVARLPPGRRRDKLEEALSELLREDLGGRVEPFDSSCAAHYASIVSDR